MSILLDSNRIIDYACNLISAEASIPLQPAKPFVKWVGGKRRVIPEILERMPSLFYNYYEPFIGGGALFFALRSMGALSDHHITISDTNLRLIRTYRAVRDDIDGLLGRLEEMQKKHCHSYYYAVRSWEIDKTKHDADVAAWFIYLNKTCFNGLYRVNKKIGVQFSHGSI